MDAQLDSKAMAMGKEYDAEFTLAQVMEMKRLYKKMGKECPNVQFCQDLADKFNNSVLRGKASIKPEQVQDWFQELRSMDLLTQMKSVEVGKDSDERVSVGKGKEVDGEKGEEEKEKKIRKRFF